jgi:predicted HTH transcriptional regulator
MTEDDFADLLVRGYEIPTLEFKGPAPRTERAFLANVARAALAMANSRDGGRVVLGVAQHDGRLDAVGLSDAQISSWGYDETAADLNAYATPSISFDLEVVPFRGARCVVIHVYEFASEPILCAQDFGGELRRGACYVRRRSMPSTSEIPTLEEMRDLLDHAIEKGIRRFLGRAFAAGLTVAPGSALVADDAQRYGDQLGDLA